MTTKKTRVERQAIDRAAPKCWCGNVAGVGQTLCGAHRDVVPEETVPKATAVTLAANIRNLLALKAREKATMAELIRWCVRELRADPRAHRLRGHETAVDRTRIIAENQQNQAKAILYLEWLATELEDRSCSDYPNKSTEGEAPCISA